MHSNPRIATLETFNINQDLEEITYKLLGIDVIWNPSKHLRCTQLHALPLSIHSISPKTLKKSHISSLVLTSYGTPQSILDALNSTHCHYRYIQYHPRPGLNHM